MQISLAEKLCFFSNNVIFYFNYPLSSYLVLNISGCKYIGYRTEVHIAMIHANIPTAQYSKGPE